MSSCELTSDDGAHLAISESSFSSETAGLGKAGAGPGMGPGSDASEERV